LARSSAGNVLRSALTSMKAFPSEGMGAAYRSPAPQRVSRRDSRRTSRHPGPGPT
jgi:hypothetical protein